MKRLLLISAILTALLAQAQDFDYIKNLNTLSKDQARRFADQIAENSKTEWEYLYGREGDGDAQIWYIDASVPDELADNIRQGKKSCEDGQCFVVLFDRADANYKFREATAKYDDLFGTWKKVFKPDADYETTVSDFKSQELLKRDKGISYKFKEENGQYWTLSNWTK